MSLLVLLAAIVLLLSLLFLGLSVVMITRKYSLRSAVITIFFAIMSIKYLIFLYLEFAGLDVNLMLFVGADVFIVFSLLVLMISR